MRKTMVRVWAVLVVLALLSIPALAAAPGENYTVDASKYKKAPPYVVALSNISLVNDFRVATVEEFKAEAAKHPDLIKEVYVTDAGGSIAKQIADIEDLIAKKVDLILVTATSPTAISPVVEKAVAAGIPVVTFDNVVETDKVTVKLVADQEELGGALAEFLCKELGGKGKIVALCGIPGTYSAIHRWEGAQKVFARYPGIKIVGQAWVDWAYDKGKRAAENFLAAHPDLDGIWTDGGPSGFGALQAVVERGGRLIPVTGTGTNGFLKLWTQLKPKGFRTLAVHEPPSDSAVALRLGLKLLQGQPVKHIETMPLFYITQENVDRLVRPDLSDGFWASTTLPEETIQRIWGKK